MHSFLSEQYTLVLVIIGTTLLGITTGAIGVFAVLRKQSLLGDALSHAALPGLALAFLITKSTHPIILMIGGSCTGILATGLTLLIAHTTTLKFDTILGVMLSVFFGIGLVLITLIQQHAYAHHALFNTFIFGNAATLLAQDILYLIITCALVLTSLALWWKECLLVTFDACFAQTIGYSTGFINILMTALLTLTIVVGLQTVGVILMSAMIIAPAAAAQQWTRHVSYTVLSAALIGGTCGCMGAIISNHFDHMPTGPTIVVLLSLVVLCSFIYPGKQESSCV